MTGESSASFPCSASIASAVAVKSLVFEAIPNRVCSSTRAGWSIDRTPYPLATTTCPSFTIETATPGTLNSRITAVTKLSSSGGFWDAAGAVTEEIAASASRKRFTPEHGPVTSVTSRLGVDISIPTFVAVHSGTFTEPENAHAYRNTPVSSCDGRGMQRPKWGEGGSAVGTGAFG